MSDTELLTETERLRIIQEERLRADIQKLLSPSTTTELSWWKFVNSSFGLWMLSALFISGAGALYNHYQQQKAVEMRKSDTIERLDLEIAYRFSAVLDQLRIIHEQSLNGQELGSEIRSMVPNALKGLYEPPTPQSAIQPLYPEYAKLPLVALLMELQRNLPRNEIDFNNVKRIVAHIMNDRILSPAKPESDKMSDIIKKHFESKARNEAEMHAIFIHSLILERWRQAYQGTVRCSTEDPFC